MPKAVNINEASDPRDVIHEAVHRLAEGKLVALPLETVYVVGAQSLRADAVRRLDALAGGAPLTLAVKDAHEAIDYAPQAGPLGRKLARRCWPGPVTISFPPGKQDSLLQSLPEETRSTVHRDGGTRLRVPAHDVVIEILRYLPAPLVLSPEDRAGKSAEISGLQQRFGMDEIDLWIDDGPCRYGEPATVVRVEDGGWKILEPGVATETTLRRLASEVYLFVCTGNTCRSPMAEAMFRKILAERLDCGEDELVDRGFVVASAGLSAVIGAPASPEAVELLRSRGIDLRVHESQPLTDRLLEQADHIYTMTRHHRDAIVAARPDVANRVEPLSRDGSDIADPMGGSLADYQVAQRQIEEQLQAILQNIRVEQGQ